jgi:hypothetical protein
MSWFHHSSHPFGSAAFAVTVSVEGWSTMTVRGKLTDIKAQRYRTAD